MNESGSSVGPLVVLGGAVGMGLLIYVGVFTAGYYVGKSNRKCAR